MSEESKFLLVAFGAIVAIGIFMTFIAFIEEKLYARRIRNGYRLCECGEKWIKRGSA